MEKRRNCSQGAISSLFHNIFNMSLTSGVKLHIHLLNVVVRFIVFLASATLIFRGTDISKCFRESIGIQDNESRLYVFGFAGCDFVVSPAICHTQNSITLISCFLSSAQWRSHTDTSVFSAGAQRWDKVASTSMQRFSTLRARWVVRERIQEVFLRFGRGTTALLVRSCTFPWEKTITIPLASDLWSNHSFPELVICKDYEFYLHVFKLSTN